MEAAFAQLESLAIDGSETPRKAYNWVAPFRSLVFVLGRVSYSLIVLHHGSAELDFIDQYGRRNPRASPRAARHH